MFKIAKLDAFAISMPLKAPIAMSGIVIATTDNLIVRAEDTDGTVGWGETSSAPTMTGETPEGSVAAARFMAERLTGTEIKDPTTIYRDLDAVMYGNQGAKSAVETALLDIAGQRTGQPLYEILGGRKRDRAPVLVMVAGGDLAAEIANAESYAEQGFPAFKVKIGIKGVEKDLERARAIRQALGPAVRISADANQGYAPADALAFAKAAGDAGLDFLEQPVAGTDLDSMRACAEVCSVDLAADEGFHSLGDIRRHHELGAAAGGSLKPIKLGGLFAVMAAANLMDGLGMKVNISGKTADTSIASMAIAHLAVAVPRLDWDANLTSHYLTDDVVENPLAYIDGHVLPGDEPGVGVTPDEEKLARYTTIK